MKQGSVLRPALAAAFALALAGSAFAADMDKSSPVLARSPATTSAPASTATCTDSSGKPVTDVSVCASGACKDSSGKPVTDPAACAASVSGGPPRASWDLKSNTK